MRYDFARFLNIRAAINPVLSPEGSRVAYLTDVTGNFQVWSVGTRGEGDARWPRQLTFLPEKVWALYGTGAAPHLIAVSDVGGNERYQFYLVSNFGVDEQGHEAYEVRRLTSNDKAIHEFGAFSRDGRQIVYTSNARNGKDFDLYRMEIDSGVESLLREGSGLRAIAAWSHDDRTLLSFEEVAPLEVDLYLLDLASGTERKLTDGRRPARYWDAQWRVSGLFVLSDATHDRGALCRLDPATGALTPMLDADFDGGRGEMEHFSLAADGRNAALSVNDGGASRLYLIDLQSGRWQRIDVSSDGVDGHDGPVRKAAPGVIGSMRFNARGTFLVLSRQTATQTSDIWSVRVLDGTCRQLTFSNTAGIDATTFIAPETIQYSSFDGLEIPALLYRPAGPEPDRGFPVVLYVHGGPTHQHRPELFVSFQFFLQQGYAVLAPNVRGSTGYGRTYTALDEVEKRMDSVEDLRAAVEWIGTQEGLDVERIAIYGRSYGGFMVLAALTSYPTLFAAGIDVVGISNWVTFLERTGPWRRAHREREYGSLEHDRDFLESISPIHKVESIRVPLLVMAGENDPRVPITESEQVVERVREAGGTVHFVRYEDEGHIFSKLENRIDSFTQIADFLREHL
jgi:dipeptidyl aminopeptidase/acylaminoacyl peptidase